MKTSLRLIGGEKIKSPNSNKTRPTTLMAREAIFNILSSEVEDSNWLDLFSGSGSVSCEAYNHGAKKIVAVEKDKTNAELCKKNLFSLKDASIRRNDIEIICKDVFSWLKLCRNKKLLVEETNNHNNQFDFIYIDPPYKESYFELLLNQLFLSDFIKENTLIIYEHSKLKEIKNSPLWQISDIRLYGQTKLTFLIKV